MENEDLILEGWIVHDELVDVALVYMGGGEQRECEWGRGNIGV